jgi:hypothetical protein
MKAWLAPLLLILTALSPLHAAHISGFVHDASNGESLPFASVYLHKSNWGGTTNESGYYAIANVSPGTYTLVASMIGYAPFEKEIELDQDDLVVNIPLNAEAIAVAAAVVTAKRDQVESFDISPGRTVLQVAELKTAPAAIEADPIRTIQTLPGVAALSDFSVGLYVRGGTPDQNLILLDGSDVYNASHLFGLFSTFPADAAKSTELLRGGYPARYGGRLSSVLNVITDEGNKEEFEGSGGASFFASRLTLQGPAGKGSWLVSGRRTHLDPLLSVAKDALDAKAFTYNFFDLQGKTHQVLSHNDQFTLAAYTGQDNLIYRFDEFGFDLEWGNRTVSSKWTHLFDSNLFGNFLITGSRFKAATAFETEDVRLLENNRLTDISFKGDVSYFPNTTHTMEVGLLIKRMSMDYNFGESNQTWVNVDVEAFHNAVYAQDNWTVNRRLTLQPGLRFNHFSNGDYTGFSPRLAARYRLDADTYLKGAVGRYHQYIFRLSREFQGISLLSNIWALADTTAAPSASIHYIAGIETRWADLDIDAEVYYKDYEKLYEINYDEQNSTEIGDIIRRGDGRAYGFDVLIKKRAGKHSGWLSLSTGLSERTIDGLNLDDNGVEQSFKSKFDRSFTVNLIHAWQFRDKWSLNSRTAYATGQPYTQILGRGEIETPSGARFNFDERGPLNGLRTPSYQRFDVALHRNFKFKTWGMKLSLQIINLTNHKNIFNYFWDDGKPRERKPAKRQEIPMLPILPSIGIDFTF